MFRIPVIDNLLQNVYVWLYLRCLEEDFKTVMSKVSLHETYTVEVTNVYRYPSCLPNGNSTFCLVNVCRKV